MTKTITIFCKNNQTYTNVPVGSTLLEIYELVGSPLPNRPMNAQVNNKVESLTYQCWIPKDVEFVDYTKNSGQRTYVRSLCHILLKAAHDVLPEGELNLEHPVSNGYYGRLRHGQKISEEQIEQIRNRMWELIRADLPFRHSYVRREEALRMFHTLGLDDKARLIDTSGLPYASYYELDGYINYFYGCLVPSTGFIHLFDLVKYNSGLLLQVPSAANLNELAPKINQDKMFHAYKEHLELQEIVSVGNVGDLNLVIQQGLASEAILISEAMQEKQISNIASQIAERFQNRMGVVFISGPSSSGKTTFCKRLMIQLMTNLIHPQSISLDDYFLNREDTPREENGEYDFESLYAIDIEYFNKDLKHLLNGEEIELPAFDFNLGKRVYKGKKLKMKEHSVLVIEGIHGLNPELTPHLSDDQKYKVYVSALTTISLDNHNWIPTTDNRLIRRIIRDRSFRGYSAKDTISRWESVRRGEDKWVFPYQENADAMFNSAMIYELSALRQYAEPALVEVSPADKEYAEAFRLRRFLQFFNYLPVKDLPHTSLLREFLGGGVFKY